jgi:hypothetical protein
MAMTNKAGLVLLGTVAFLVAGFALWCFTMRKWAAPYQEANASWRIRGICTNAQTGAPINGAQVTASFTEPIAFKHHWRNPPPLTITNVVTETDRDGRFEVAGEGGSVYIKAQAQGYRHLEPWENWSHSARNRITRVETNAFFSLQPVSKNGQK